MDRRIYKTHTNFSGGSVTQRSNLEEEHPLVETLLADEELAGLDRFPSRKMSENEEDHHDSYLELRENVAIMEERICVLSHKLEENKREMAVTRTARDRAEDAHKAELDKRRQVAAALVEAEGEVERLGRRVEELERERGAAERERAEWEGATVKSEEANAQLSSQIEYLVREVRKKEQEIGLLDNEVGRKGQELEEANEAIAELQAEVGRVRSQFREELEGKDRENRELKRKIKEHKDRMETEGINLKFEEASKLKKFIEENEALHQREILKLDKTYSAIVGKYEEELRRMKNNKVEL